MAKIDVEGIKAQVAAARAARPPEPLLSGISRWEVFSNEHAAALLRSHLEKTGLDLQALERAAASETPPSDGAAAACGDFADGSLQYEIVARVDGRGMCASSWSLQNDDVDKPPGSSPRRAGTAG